LRITQIRDRVAPYTSVPQYVYYKNNGEELQWFSTTNAVNALPFYRPTQDPTPASEIGTTTNPATKWVRIDWAQNLVASAYEGTTLDKNLARFFAPGKSELFPFDQVTLDAYQGKLKQNPGY
jgi:starch-binding outer membrane protein, SusD/RagB family